MDQAYSHDIKEGFMGEHDNNSEPRISREDLLKMLAEQIHSIDRLPNHAKFSFVTNADLGYCLSILYGLHASDPVDSSE